MNQTIIKVTDVTKSKDDEARTLFINAAHIMTIRRTTFHLCYQVSVLEMVNDDNIMVEEPIDEILAQIKAGGVA